jgi:hypothetical protein
MRQYQPQSLHDLEPRNLIDFEIGEQLREPRGVIPDRQPPDQRGAIGLGAGERVEQFAGPTFAENADDPGPKFHGRATCRSSCHRP